MLSHSTHITTWAVALLGLFAKSTGAVNLTYYAPEASVDPAFANWIGSFYQAAEATNTTAAGYSAFFDAHSTIELAGWNPSQDVKDGLMVREHFPTTVSIDGDYPIEKKFHLYGLTKAHYKNSTCAVESYETKFTILKNDGSCNLEPEAKSLVNLELIEQTPSSVSCDSF
ncbi:uncharacterized protein N7511_001320 [Penicillium nucicola]|uniref:uncharacterized protein n=1 Tax=Penicillium nucicola TaxID=1850975 RepID=UPI002544E1EC|nr:uncharacterized protein N7511_001320 [Penicillium nucicola]KAJ5776309.1 hypothetical protein N7511_001320 [Penicillium nucicola]